MCKWLQLEETMITAVDNEDAKEKTSLHMLAKNDIKKPYHIIATCMTLVCSLKTTI